MNKQRRTYEVRSVTNGFDLLAALLPERDNRTLWLLAQDLGLSSRKTASLLAALEKKGMVERDGRGGYHLGLSAYELALHIQRSTSLTKLAHPIMVELARKHDEAVYLTVPSDNEVIFLDMVDSMQKVKTAPIVGRRFPFFTNAAGKVIKAATSPGDTTEELVTGLVSTAPAQDIERLAREIETIRQRGVAIDNGGLGNEICAVAVAIRDYAGWAVGALTMLAPSFRMLQERLEQEIIPSMLDGAAVLSKKFGCTKYQMEI